jgi:hypothetical protein
VTPVFIRSYRVFFSLLALTAIARQLTISVASGFPLPHFFSYFTIQSNLLAAAVLLAVAFRPSATAEWWRGLAVVCMAITGVVFNLLLRDVDAATIPWVNDVVHVVMPVAMIWDWLTAPPRDPIAWPAALRWLIVPLLWLAYTFARGSAVGWYPYPFLDVGRLGAASVAATCAAIAAGFLATSALVMVTGNRKAPRL